MPSAFLSSSATCFFSRLGEAGASASGPVLIRLRLSSVGGGPSPRRQAEEILCTPRSRRPRLSPPACTSHRTSVGLWRPIAPTRFQTPKLERFRSFESCGDARGAHELHHFTIVLWVTPGSHWRDSKGCVSMKGCKIIEWFLGKFMGTFTYEHNLMWHPVAQTLFVWLSIRVLKSTSFT